LVPEQKPQGYKVEMPIKGVSPIMKEAENIWREKRKQLET